MLQKFIIIIIFVFIYIQERIFIKNCCVVDYGGRMGNRLTEYIFARLLLANHNLSFQSSLEFPFPFNYSNKTGRVFKKTSFASKISLFKFLHFGLDLKVKMNINNYLGRRKELYDILNIPVINKITYDVVIHVRLEDVFNEHPYYTLLPLSFYKQVLVAIQVKTKVKSICIVSKPIDDTQHIILNNIQSYVFNLTNVMPILQINSIEKDYITFMSTPVFIASTSSFWMWPVFLSSVLKEIHFPIFGQTLYMGFTKKSVVDEDRVFYGYDLPFKKKITLQNLNLIYDI